MTAKAADLSKALRRHVFPMLRAAGFDDATGRKFWRHNGGKTDYLEISSLSTYRALTDRTTTASFHVRLGISLPQYGCQHDPFHKDHIPVGPNGPRPRESQMPIRGVVCPKDAPQLRMGQWGWECQSLWRVETVQEADHAAIDLREQLGEYTLEWLDRKWDMRAILELLQSEERRLFIAKAKNGSHLQLDAEMPGSPIRQAHIAMAKGEITAGNRE